MKKKLILEEIYRQNKHWNNENFFIELREIKYKRKLFAKILPYLDKRQIISIVGLRRTGKTILLKQIIRYLTKKTKAKNILFLTFDEAIFPAGVTLSDYIKVYLKEVASKNNRIYIFFDEIQYADKWQHIIKRYYDTEPNIKFIISGSSSLFLKKKSTESLAGRIYEFTLPVLDFEEYMAIKGADANLLAGYGKYGVGIAADNVQLEKAKTFFRRHGRDLEKEFEHYLKFGQFPEIAAESDSYIIKKYLTDSIYKKTIEYDIPKLFGAEKVDELKFLFQVLINETGSIIETGNISKEIGLEHKTIKKYLSYFENSFLIYFLYNFSRSFRKSKRLLKKVYLGSGNFFSAFHNYKDAKLSSKQLGFLAENYCFSLLKKSFTYLSFYQIRGEEFDFVGANDPRALNEFQYFEVKYRDNFSAKDFKFIARTAKKNNCFFRIISKNKLEIHPDYAIIPVWLLK